MANPMEQTMREILPQKGFSFHTKNHWIKDRGGVKWDVYAPYANSYYMAYVKIDVDGIKYHAYTFDGDLNTCLEKATTSLRQAVARIRDIATALDDVISKDIDYSEVGKLMEET